MSNQWVECVSCGYEYMTEQGRGWRTKCPACGSREFDPSGAQGALTNTIISDILEDGRAEWVRDLDIPDKEEP